VSPRAIGCAALAGLAFVAVGVIGLSMALPSAGCPDRLQWFERAYLPDGVPAPEPSLEQGEPVRIGSTFIGLTTRDVYGPPGSSPPASGEMPDVLVLDCGDGSFLAYRVAP
jgi:hypothetical protein